MDGGGGGVRAGWVVKPLGEVCSFDKLQGIHRNLPYVGLEHIASHTAQFIGSIDPFAVKSATFRFSSQHVLYGRLRPYLNKALAPDFEGHCSTEIFPLKPKPELSREYLLYWLLADETTEKINATCTGARMPRADMNEVLSFEFPLPPLPEQHRIVAILDEAFDGIATAKANAEKNLQNARALFESHLQSVFTEQGEGWVERRLGDLVTRLTNGYVGPTREIYQEAGVPYLLARHVRSNRLFFDGKTFITDEFNLKNKKSILKANDVLLVQSGHIGHSAVVTKEHEGHNCHAMIVITSAEGAFIGPYLSLFFNSSGMQQKFQEIRSGSTVPHLTCGEVKELMVPLPDLATQQRVVDHSQELGAETQRLESIYQQKLTTLDDLKKSILHQAFSGQL